MKTPLRILIVEDSEDDTLLLVNELERGGYTCIYERVETPDAMINQLLENSWDLVIADYSLPHFNGMDALIILKESQIDLPFIIVSGAIKEATAVDLMNAGAHDFIMKGSYARLIPAIGRELREAEIRRRRKQVEELILNQNEFLKNILEAIDTPMYVIDVNDYNILLANSAANLASSESITCYVLSHQSTTPCDSNEHPCPLEIVKKTKKPTIVNHIHHDNEGNLQYLEIHGYPIFDENGNVIQLIEHSLDITERKKTEAKLHFSEWEKSIILDSILDIMAYYESPDLEVIWTNSAASIELNIPMEEITGNYCYEIWNNRDNPCQNCPVLRAFNTKHTEDTELTYPDGKTWLIKAFPVFSDQGLLQGVVEVKRDISERKALEAAHIDYTINLERLVEEKTQELQKETDQLQNTLSEFKKIQQRLIESEKLASIGLLTAGIAHEINNPIMGIINYAQIIKDELIESRVIDINSKPYSFIDNLIVESERISEIVADLLAFAREDRGQDTLTDMSEVIKSSLSLLYPKLKRSQIDVELHFQKDLPKIPMRPRNIQQVVLNVLQNSIDALKEKYGAESNQGCKKIQIKTKYVTRNKKQYGQIIIKDNGVGIQAKDIKNVFEPFFTTKSSSKEYGTGLGLSISYSIIKSHSGQIKIRSKYKKYTTVEILLPIKPN